jgi:hypothetical protein
MKIEKNLLQAEKMLQGGITSVAKEWHKPLPPQKGIDWEHVSQLEILNLYELCYLSVGISPQTLRIKIPNDQFVATSENLCAEIDRRVTVAKNNARSGKLPTIDGGKPERNIVSGEIEILVSDFVAFADSMKWSLPPEFPRPQCEEERPEGLKRMPDKPEKDIDTPFSIATHEAIRRFPEQYPDYKKRPPKLDVDVRPWLKSEKIAKNDREAHILAQELVAYFKL